MKSKYFKSFFQKLVYVDSKLHEQKIEAFGTEN